MSVEETSGPLTGAVDAVSLAGLQGEKVGGDLVERHHNQIGLRPRLLERAMVGLGAWTVAPPLQDPDAVAEVGSAGPDFRSGLALLREAPAPPEGQPPRWQGLRGQYSYAALHRFKSRRPDGRAFISAVLAFFKAWYLGRDRFGVGGTTGNMAAWDLSFLPLPHATRGGKILRADKRETLNLGLALDLACQSGADGTLDRRVLPCRLNPDQLPRFWAGFRPGRLPRGKDSPAMRDKILELARPSGPGPGVFSERCATGGRVEEVVRRAQEITVHFASGQALRLPPCAVVLPAVRAGAELSPDAPVADLLPRESYDSWAKLERTVAADPEVLQSLRDRALAASSWEQAASLPPYPAFKDGRVYAPVELVLTDLALAEGHILEDVRHLVLANTPHWPARVSVLAGAPASLTCEQGYPFDLRRLREPWAVWGDRDRVGRKP